MRTITEYLDAHAGKIPNRRVMVQTLADGAIRIGFKKLLPIGNVVEDIPPYMQVICGRIMVTTIEVTREAAETLLTCLYKELDREEL